MEKNKHAAIQHVAALTIERTSMRYLHLVKERRQVHDAVPLGAVRMDVERRKDWSAE
ncbi:hypothetical protein ISP15_08145 [Dyella jejuensis]|uniref:Uncharacterized protein n=1 Tax=Dyella jejuensis TaxID=1432009 RepID=A0ABW8JGT4_9GAMM